MSDMLEFTTKPKAAAETDEQAADAAADVFRCTLDGVELVSSKKPKDALIAQLAPVTARRTPPAMKIKLALDFLGDALDEPGRSHVADRLLDPADELDAEDVMPMLQAMGDHWKSVADRQKADRRR